MEKHANHSWNVLRASLPGLRRLSVLFPQAQFFCPVVTTRHFNRRNRKIVTRRELVMPGYAFSAKLHPMDLRDCPIEGIRGFLRDASRNVVEVDYIRTLLPFYRELCSQANLASVEDVAPQNITDGMEVRWKPGTVLEGSRGTVVKVHDDGTVMLELRKDERAISVTSTTDLLEAV